MEMGRPSRWNWNVRLGAALGIVVVLVAGCGAHGEVAYAADLSRAPTVDGKLIWSRLI
jgi:hypothetical protein